MKKLWNKIKFWYWWKFKASEQDKIKHDFIMYGNAFEKDGKRIDPNKFYIK